MRRLRTSAPPTFTLPVCAYLRHSKINTVNLRYPPCAARFKAAHALSVLLRKPQQDGQRPPGARPAMARSPGQTGTHNVFGFSARRYGEPYWASKSCVRLKVNG